MAETPNPPFREDASSGSPQNGEPAFLVIGRIRKPHGVSGEMSFEVISDFPERIVPGLSIFIGSEKKRQKICNVRQSHHGLIIALENISNPETASFFTNHFVYVPTLTEPRLPEGHFYHHDLIGISVIDTQGNHLGKIVEVLSTGSNDVYVIRNNNIDKNEILIPAIKSVILDIDQASHIMMINPPEWV